MAKTFKVGDRVTSVAKVGDCIHGGRAGTVMSVKDGTVEVAFEGWTEGHAGYSETPVSDRFFFFDDSEDTTDGFSGLRLQKPKAVAKPSQAYKGNGKHEWELVLPRRNLTNSTVPALHRLRVPGGWLYGATFVPLPEVVKHAV